MNFQVWATLHTLYILHGATHSVPIPSRAPCHGEYLASPCHDAPCRLLACKEWQASASIHAPTLRTLAVPSCMLVGRARSALHTLHRLVQRLGRSRVRGGWHMQAIAWHLHGTLACMRWACGGLAVGNGGQSRLHSRKASKTNCQSCPLQIPITLQATKSLQCLLALCLA